MLFFVVIFNLVSCKALLLPTVSSIASWLVWVTHCIDNDKIRLTQTPTSNEKIKESHYFLRQSRFGNDRSLSRLTMIFLSVSGESRLFTDTSDNTNRELSCRRDFDGRRSFQIFSLPFAELVSSKFRRKFVFHSRYSNKFLLVGDNNCSFRWNLYQPGEVCVRRIKTTYSNWAWSLLPISVQISRDRKQTKFNGKTTSDNKSIRTPFELKLLNCSVFLFSSNECIFKLREHLLKYFAQWHVSEQFHWEKNRDENREQELIILFVGNSQANEKLHTWNSNEFRREKIKSDIET